MAKATLVTGNMTFIALAITSVMTAAALLDKDILARSWDGQNTLPAS